MVAFLSSVALTGQVEQATQRVEQSSPDLTSVRSLAQESAARNLHEARARPPPQAPREIGYTHVEVDLSQQQLSVIDDSGRVVKTLPVSSGSGKWFTSEGRTRKSDYAQRAIHRCSQNRGMAQESVGNVVLTRVSSPKAWLFTAVRRCPQAGEPRVHPHSELCREGIL